MLQIARARSELDMIPPSDCALVLRVKRFSSRSQECCDSVYDEAGNVIETQEHKGDFREW
jgi:hypothetical protein